MKSVEELVWTDAGDFFQLGYEFESAVDDRNFYYRVKGRKARFVLSQKAWQAANHDTRLATLRKSLVEKLVEVYGAIPKA